MTDLRFDFDWLNAEGVNGPELAATWASLRIRAGDSVITKVFDQRARTSRENVYVPLYPLAEWLVSNWWFLTREFHSPAKENDATFFSRHALIANVEGYAFPDLEVVSSGLRTLLTWRTTPNPWARVEFLEKDSIWLSNSEFQDACAGFIDQVIRRLVSFGIEDTFLQEEWGIIQCADEEETKFCETAAGLGWDPYALNDEERDRVIWISDRLGNLIYEAVPALNANALDSELTAIDQAFEQAKNNTLHLQKLEALCGESRGYAGRGIPPWQEGYELAQQLREDLGLDSQPLPSMTEVVDVLGGDTSSIEKVTQPMEAFKKAPMIDGVIIMNQDDAPAFAFRPLPHEESNRFHFCRAMCELVTASGSRSLITKARSERQQRNRAFAAEFLAPSSGLREIVSTKVVDSDHIDEIATFFAVSPFVIERQVKNHGIARVWES